MCIAVARAGGGFTEATHRMVRVPSRCTGGTLLRQPVSLAEGGLGKGPQPWQEMHIDPEATWNRACKAVVDSAKQISDLIEHDIPPRPNAVEGGSDGIRVASTTGG
eukprot:COSAG02_NODE_1353_length_13103_cov_74.629652_4_plen_106_part_00